MKSDVITATGITLSEAGAALLDIYPIGSVVMVARSGILRRYLPVATLGVAATANQDQKVTVPFEMSTSQWIAIAFRAFDLHIRTELGKAGTTVESVNFDQVKEMLLPLPPACEQERISARVADLLQLAYEYGALEGEREQLDAELPDCLRKSILQMAVQGKLVPQDPADEPALVLLERIREEKRQLITEGKCKAPKGGESVIYRASDGGYYEKRGKGEPVPIGVPFDIPDSWEWVRVSSVFNLVRGSGIKRTEVTASGKPCVRYGELYTTYTMHITQVASHTTSEVYEKAQKLLDNEIIATLTGENDIDIGRTIVNKTGEIIAFGGDLLALKGGYIDGRFAALCMNSSYMGLQRTAAASGNIIVHLSASKIGSFLMAMPPIEEQRRIVAHCCTLLDFIG